VLARRGIEQESCAAPSQPHSWLIAVRELDAGGFEGGDNAKSRSFATAEFPITCLKPLDGGL
jgi:hypothetical protein